MVLGLCLLLFYFCGGCIALTDDQLWVGSAFLLFASGQWGHVKRHGCV